MSNLDSLNSPRGACYSIREQLLLLDNELRVEAASCAYFEGFNVTSEQTLHRRLHHIGKGQWNIPALLERLKELPLGDGSFADFDVEGDFPGLGRRNMLLGARRIPGGGAEPGAILLGIEDVTDRRRMRVELVEQRAWFETTLTSISDAVIVTNTKARINYMNPTAQLLTGWTQEQALGAPLAEVFNIVDEKLRQPVESPVDKAIREGAIVGLANHTVLIARDGSHMLIDDSAAPIRDKAGGLIGVVMVFHNVTHERRAKHQLEISEVRYRRLFETAHDGILILDAQSAQVLDVNKFLQHLLGYPASFFMGKELWEIGIFEDAERCKAVVAELQRTGSIRYENLPLQDQAGRQIPVEFVSNVYREGDHNVIQCNIRDITERKIAGDEIRRMKDAAEDANRAKSEFLANMSHEIRTPMTAILGFSDMMLQPHQDPIDRADCVQTVRRNALHLLELINDILDLSKIEAGKMAVERISCDVALLLSDLISLMRPRALEKRLAFNVRFDSPMPHCIKTDPTRLRQILVNLVGNALKFTTAGSIELRISVEGEGAGNILCVEVIDSGIGIAPENFDRLFQPFIQGEESTTRKFGGTGLGLTISQQLAKLLGGDIQVTSELGVGSTFTLRIDGGSFAGAETLTNLNDKMLTRCAPMDKWRDIPIKGRILLVEDGIDNQRLLSAHLRNSGADVVIAENGQVAVDLMATNPFDLVLMDMQMPVMDGYTATAELRRRGFTMPVIALTAYAMEEDRKKCMASGCTDYLSKPINRDLLLNTVSRCMAEAPQSKRRESSSASWEPSGGRAPGSIDAPRVTQAGDSIKSNLSGRSTMKDLIAEFVEGLPVRVAALIDSLRSNDFTALQRVLHQLRGAGGGFGFDPVTEPAGTAEQAIIDSGGLQVITDNVNRLIHTIRQIEGYDQSKEQPTLAAST